MTRRRRRCFALLALLGLLFQQLAMAAYVCPIDATAVHAGGVTPPPCHQSRDTDGVRCHAHCHPQALSTDHAPIPGVPAALAPSTTWWPAAARRPLRASDPGACALTARAAAPPLTVRYCTFQI